MSDNKFLEAALEYAKRRWKIFPIEPGGYLPVMVGVADDKPIRFEIGGSSCNPAKIRTLWKEWPEANIGLALRESKVYVYRPDNLDGSYKEVEAYAINNGIPCLMSTHMGIVLTRYIFDEHDIQVIGSAMIARCNLQSYSYILLPPVVDSLCANYEWRNNDLSN